MVMNSEMTNAAGTGAVCGPTCNSCTVAAQTAKMQYQVQQLCRSQYISKCTIQPAGATIVVMQMVAVKKDGAGWSRTKSGSSAEKKELNLT